MSEQLIQPTEPPPDSSETVTPAQSSINFQEHLLYKNRLQEYTQRSAIPMPIYQTVNEGSQHAPRFRSFVLVDGCQYTSLNTFAHRKAAEQAAAKVALDGISKKLKDDGRRIICEDTVFCKSILNEYAVKLKLEMPIYKTVQQEGLLPSFVSSLVFNGVTYTGDAGRNKKEAEQLAARAVILSILGNSESETSISEIVKSKFKLLAALHRAKETSNTHNGTIPAFVNTGNGSLVPLGKRKEVEATGVTDNIPISAIPLACSGQPSNVTVACLPLHEFKKPKPEPVTSELISPPIVFVPPVLQVPIVDSTSARKLNKNRRKAKKKLRVDAELPVAVVPLSQLPPCSVAQ